NQVISTNVQNTQAASSVIMDADVASVKADLSSADVKVQAAVAALAQAAQLPQNLLRLIQS
ncbi:MAG: flagellin, partial [Rhodospirillaceae bacterium]|nr:flagellin [Rhodospirillaceae bacterium]